MGKYFNSTIYMVNAVLHSNSDTDKLTFHPHIFFFIANNSLEILLYALCCFVLYTAYHRLNVKLCASAIRNSTRQKAQNADIEKERAESS